MSGSSEESLLQFPCDFPIKIMGAGGPDFQRLVVDLVRWHAPDLDETLIKIQDSRTGRYQSVTVIVRARHRVQLDAIYRELSGHPDIRMVL